MRGVYGVMYGVVKLGVEVEVVVSGFMFRRG